MARKPAQKPAHKPCPEVADAWAHLLRVQQVVVSGVEKDLKAAGFPPLAWYGVLMHLAEAPRGAARPVDLEKQMLMPQYAMSRLIDRLTEAGLAERRTCPSDGRGQFVVITDEGRVMRKKMSTAYAAILDNHIGTKLSTTDSVKLSSLLAQLL